MRSIHRIKCQNDGQPFAPASRVKTWPRKLYTLQHWMEGAVLLLVSFVGKTWTTCSCSLVNSSDMPRTCCDTAASVRRHESHEAHFTFFFLQRGGNTPPRMSDCSMEGGGELFWKVDRETQNKSSQLPSWRRRSWSRLLNSLTTKRNFDEVKVWQSGSHCRPVLEHVWEQILSTTQHNQWEQAHSSRVFLCRTGLSGDLRWLTMPTMTQNTYPQLNGWNEQSDENQFWLGNPGSSESDCVEGKQTQQSSRNAFSS